MNYYKDADSTETKEWLQAFESVLKHADKDRSVSSKSLVQYGCSRRATI